MGIEKGKLLIFIASLLALTALIALYFNIPNMINLPSRLPAAQKLIKEQTGLNLYMEGVKLKFTPSLTAKFQLKNLLVKKSEDGAKILQARGVEANVHLLPLIFKKVKIKEIRGEHLEINVIKDKNGNLDIEKYLQRQQKLPCEIIIKKAGIALKNYKITLLDHWSNNTFALNGTNLKTGAISLKEGISLSTVGTLTSNSSSSEYAFNLHTGFPILKNLNKRDFVLKGFVNNLELSPFTKYLKTYLDKDLTSVNGRLNLLFDTSAGEDSPVFMRATVKNLEFSRVGLKNTLKADKELVLSLLGDYDSKNLYITSAYIRSNMLDLNLKGKILNYFDKSPQIDLTAEVKNSSLNSLIKLVPDSIPTPEDSIRKLKNYNAYGTINGTLSLKDNLFRPSVYGKLDFKDVYVIKPIENAPKAFGSLDFQKDKVKVFIKAFTSPSQYVIITGTSELYGTLTGEYSIISTPSVDLKKAHFVLIPVRDVIGFNLGPLPIMKIDGTGSINLKARGTIKNANCYGTFKMKNAKASMKNLNTELSSGNGELVFNEKTMYFKNVKAYMEGALLEFTGWANEAGRVEMGINIFNINTQKALEIVETSPSLDFLQKDLQIVEEIKGTSNLRLNLKGTVKNFQDPNLVSKLKPGGKIFLSESTIKLKPFSEKLNKVKGVIEFAQNYKLNLTGFIGNSDFLLNGDIFGDIAKVDVTTKKFMIHDGAKFAQIPLPSSVPPLEFYSKLHYEGNFRELNPQKAKIDGVIIPLNNSKLNPDIRFNSGKIILKNNIATINKLNFNYLNSKASFDGKITDIFAKKPNVYGTLSFSNFAFSNINKLKELVADKTLLALLNSLDEHKGNFSGIATVSNDNLRANIDFNDISARYKPKNSLIKLKSGHAQLLNDILTLKALNLTFDDIPIYFNSTITNLNTNPIFNCEFSTRINEAELDKHLNSYLTYPVKLKGDLGAKGTLKGTLNDYELNSVLTLEKDSDLAYMGANLGDEDKIRQIKLNARMRKNFIFLKNLEYLKHEISQNNKTYPLSMITMKGAARYKDKDFILNNLKIKTHNPTTAKLFNVIFKKSLLKNGLFNCDITANGKASSPVLEGFFELNSANLPVFDAIINNISATFNKNTIYTNMTGKLSGTDFTLNAESINSIVLPLRIKKIDFHSREIGIDNLLNLLGELSKRQTHPVAANITIDDFFTLSPKNIIIENGTFKADKITYGDFLATNLSANYSQNDKGILNLNDISLNVADGKMSGNAFYDFKNTHAKLDMVVKNVDANKISKSLIGVKDQIFGVLNGNLSISGAHLDTPEGLKTLSGSANFAIENGRLPKLGSLEYLLKASNLIKSGIFGLTLNNIIEVLIPYKTGEFSSISGIASINKGNIENIEIFSKGKDLSIYVHGMYDLVNNHADLEVLGRLSRKIVNILGPVGNASINSLLNLMSGMRLDNASKNVILVNINKIPGIEITDNDYRIFAAEIEGDLNGDDYVREFKWVE